MAPDLEALANISEKSVGLIRVTNDPLLTSGCLMTRSEHCTRIDEHLS